MANVNLDAFAAAIRQMESGSASGNYTAKSKTSSARGAYQYVKGTWGGYGGYASADQAPKAVQDARFKADAARFAKKYNGDVGLMAMAHFQGEGAADETARGSRKWIGAKDANGMQSSSYMSRIKKDYAKYSGQTSVGGNVDRSQIDYTPATGAGTSAMPSMQPTDIMTIMQQALGLVGGAQGAAGSVPDYTGYLDVLAQQREDSLKAEMASLDTLVANATDRLRSQLAGSQSALPGMAQAAGKDFSAIGAQLPGMQNDGTHAASVTSLQALGVDPSAYSRQVAGNASGMATELGGAQQYMSTLSAGTDDSIRNQMSQLMAATHDQAQGDLATTALKAKLGMLQQSNQLGYTTASDFAKTKYGAEVSAQGNLTSQVLQAMSTIGSLAQGNASQQLQAADLAARLQQYASQNGIDLARLQIDQGKAATDARLADAQIGSYTSSAALDDARAKAALDPNSGMSYSDQQKAKLDAATKKKYDSMNASAASLRGVLVKQYPKAQAAHEIDVKAIGSGDLSKFIPLLASTSGSAEASAWLTSWYEKNLPKLKGETKAARTKRVTTSVSAAMKDYNGLVTYKNGG